MIVKDEAHVVCETLASVLPYIADFVVVDTGSADGTQRIVRQFFDRHQLPGLVFERPWRDFGHNRSEALELARRHSAATYLWMIDADDVLVGEPRLGHLHLDGYRLRHGSGFEYWRPQIFKRSRPWRYVGVLHEYAACDADGLTVGKIDGEYYVNSRRLGSRNRISDKYARDADVLATAVESNPHDPRNVFYLAQSYFDAGDFERALETYTRRAAMGGWEQEVFYSRFRVAQCRERLRHPADAVRADYLECARLHPSRAEPLVEAARLARVAGDFAAAYEYARRAGEIPHPGSDALFVHTGAYEYRARDEQAVAAYYLGRHDEAFRLNQELLDAPALPEADRRRVERNRDFSVPFVKDELLVYDAALVQRITERSASAEPRVTLSITSCKRLDLFVRTMTSFLSACEDVDLIDQWICVDDNSSEADRAEMQRLFPFFQFVCKGPAEKGHARSMNIIRDLVRTPFLLHLEDDWQFFVRRRYIEPAIEILQECPDVGQVLFNRNYAETLEDREIPGGHLACTWEHGLRYRVHEHYAAGSEDHRRFQAAHGSRPNAAYWPHYSLRPSVLKTSVHERVGTYDEEAAHFELEYARRYVDAGLRSAFFDGIYCLHIGRLTSQRSDPAVANAYTLNDMPQFESRRPIRIQLLSRSWPSSQELCRQWNKMSRGAGRWNGVEVTHEDRDIDFYAIFNAPPDGAQFVAERSIVFQMEPRKALDELPPEWRSPDPARFRQVRHHAWFPNVSEWHLGKTYDELSTMEIEKSKQFSTVTSDRNVDIGQQLRIAFIHYLQARGIVIDVYGRSNQPGFENHRGPLPPFQKDAGLLPYKYTFAAENHAEPNYFSEKLADALLAECLCFYWGCPNVTDYLDPRAFIQLDLSDFKQSATLIESALAENQWEQRIDIIRREKRKLLDYYQVFPTLERIVTTPELPETVVINLDRRPDRLQRFARQAERCGLRGFRRVAAVDGQKLSMNPKIRRLFRGNDHNYRRGIVGCALSHLDLWRTIRTPTLVFEDDAELCDGFLPALQALLERVQFVDPDWDILILGYQPWETADSDQPPSQVPTIRTMDWSRYMGGAFGYVLSSTGARKLVERADQRGVQVAIDWFVMHQADMLHAYCANPPIVSSPCAQVVEGCDTDIQTQGSCL